MASIVRLACAAAAAMLLGGCCSYQYFQNGSWETAPCGEYRNPCPSFPAPERPWNYCDEWGYRTLDPQPIAVPIFYNPSASGKTLKPVAN